MILANQSDFFRAGAQTLVFYVKKVVFEFMLDHINICRNYKSALTSDVKFQIVCPLGKIQRTPMI